MVLAGMASPEQYGPTTPTTASVTSFCAACTATWGLQGESCASRVMVLPITPPCLLAFVTASLTALMMSMPADAYWPLSGANAPILMLPLCAGAAGGAARAGAVMPELTRQRPNTTVQTPRNR